jgi:hypothetical protein
MNSFGSAFNTGPVPNPQSQSTVSLNFFEPQFLRNFKIPDGICLAGDFHIIRGDIVMLAGPPGVGKSRAAVALAVCGASQSPWFGYPVHQKFKTMIFQAENSAIRLHLEIDEIGHCIDDHLLILEPPEHGLAFSEPRFQSAAAKAVSSWKPDLVVIDPWNAVAAGEKARDISDAFRAIRAVIPSGINRPAILIVAHIRKPRVDERADGRALLHSVVGSYMMGSVPRAVFILQHASDKTDEDRVVITCCKNNNGSLGVPSAWKRTCGGIFDPVDDFDWNRFRSGKGADQEYWRLIPEILCEIGNCRKAVLVDDLISRFKIKKTAAYAWINKAGAAALIRFDNHSGTYYVPGKS